MEEYTILRCDKFANFVVETIFIPNNHIDYEVAILFKGNIYKDYWYQTNDYTDAKEMHENYIDIIKNQKL